MTLTLAQGQIVDVPSHRLRIAFTDYSEPCDDTAAASCLPWVSVEHRFRVEVNGGPFVPLELRRIQSEFRFEGIVDDNLIIVVDRLTVRSPDDWVATIVVRRGLEL